MCLCAHSGLYYHRVHMCRAALGASRLARHVRRSPHLAVEAAVRLWPLKPWTRSQANAAQHRPVRTQQNRGAAPLTGESWHRIRCCMGVCTSLCVSVCAFFCCFFYGNKASKGRLSVSRRFDGFGGGMKDKGSKEWDEWFGDEWISKTWQLLFFFVFFPRRVYTHGCGGNVSISWLFLTFCCIFGIFYTPVFRKYQLSTCALFKTLKLLFFLLEILYLIISLTLCR